MVRQRWCGGGWAVVVRWWLGGRRTDVLVEALAQRPHDRLKGVKLEEGLRGGERRGRGVVSQPEEAGPHTVEARAERAERGVGIVRRDVPGGRRARDDGCGYGCERGG
eukprot:794731-Prymnesium_polylepis.1